MKPIWSQLMTIVLLSKKNKPFLRELTELQKNLFVHDINLTVRKMDLWYLLEILSEKKDGDSHNS